jgi:hypothetical protein
MHLTLEQAVSVLRWVSGGWVGGVDVDLWRAAKTAHVSPMSGGLVSLVEVCTPGTGVSRQHVGTSLPCQEVLSILKVDV